MFQNASIALGEKRVSHLLEIKDLSISFKGEEGNFDPLVDVNFFLEKGQRVAVVGESGSGKTLSLLAAMGLLPAGANITNGQIKFDGSDITYAPETIMKDLRGRRMAMVFQNAQKSLNPIICVGRQIADVYRCHFGGSHETAWKRAIEALDETGIPDPENRSRLYPHEYSGGMAQRVMIAMALACRPDLLIADEPTSGLDVTIQIQVLDLIRRIAQETGAALIIITHDINIIKGLCKRIVVMYSGMVMEEGDLDLVIEQPANPYTEALLACSTSNSDGFNFIPGRAPDPRTRLTGCPFAPRCERAKEMCQSSRPQIRKGLNRRVACHFPIVYEKTN